MFTVELKHGFGVWESVSDDDSLVGLKVGSKSVICEIHSNFKLCSLKRGHGMGIEPELHIL